MVSIRWTGRFLDFSSRAGLPTVPSSKHNCIAQWLVAPAKAEASHYLKSRAGLHEHLQCLWARITSVLKPGKYSMPCYRFFKFVLKEVDSSLYAENGHICLW